MIQATEQLREEQGGEVNEEMEKSAEWLDLVMERSKFLLLQMASSHDSIKDFLSHHLKRSNAETDRDGLLLYVSKHSFTPSYTYPTCLCHFLISSYFLSSLLCSPTLLGDNSQ